MLDVLSGALQILAQAADAASTAPAAAGLVTQAAPAVDAAQALGSAAANAASALAVPGAADAAMNATAAATAPALTSLPGAEPSMTTAANVADTGMLHFIGQSDMVGKTLFGILVLMSLISWYLIFVKWYLNVRTRARTRKFVREFWAAGSLEQVENEIATHGATEPFSHVASHAIHAGKHHAKYGGTKLEEKGSTSGFITRTIRKVIDEETAKLENGLTVLASIGSTAPFVGLFGTVWGVYHALIGIGLSDGVTINRIAGPVGEALIMTGLGLAVAIPAVLAYNGFVRSNRVYLASLDAFAHDLYTFLSTGQQQVVDNGRSRGRGRRAEPAVAREA